MAREQYYAGEYKGDTRQHGYETTESMYERAKENPTKVEPYNNGYADLYPPASSGATVQAERRAYMPKELGMGYGVDRGSPFKQQLAFIGQAIEALEGEITKLTDKLEQVLEQPVPVPVSDNQTMEEGITDLDQNMINTKARIRNAVTRLADLSRRVVI